MTRYLVEGDPLDPAPSDIIAIVEFCAWHQPPKDPENWRVMSGGEAGNTWARIAFRYELEEETE